MAIDCPLSQVFGGSLPHNGFREVRHSCTVGIFGIAKFTNGCMRVKGGVLPIDRSRGGGFLTYFRGVCSGHTLKGW